MYTLRPWRTSDAASVARHANNPNIAQNLRDGFPHPYTFENAVSYIDHCLRADRARDLFLAVDVEGEAVGSVGVFLQTDVYKKSAEIGYWLAEPFWGRGIMSGAVKEVCALAFTRFDIVRLYAEPYADNTGSRRVLEKAGFALEGVLRKSVYKNGVYHDSCLYALIRESHP